jgi:hypothetical protein
MLGALIRGFVALCLAMLPHLQAGPTPATVAVTPATVTLLPGSQQQFTAVVKGTSKTLVTWSCTAGGGTIGSGTGLYTAPATPGSYTVRATLNSDPTKSGSAVISVSKNVQVALSPASSTVYSGDSIYFSASVAGGSDNAQGVTWSVSGGTIQNSSTASMSYQAPSTAGDYLVTATSVEDSSKKATAAIRVLDSSSVTLSVSTTPNPLAGPPLSVSTIWLYLRGGVTGIATWSATGGKLSQTETIGNASLTYQFPTLPGGYQITVTPKDDPTRSLAIPVTVAAAGTPTIYGIEVGNQAYLAGTSAHVLPYFTAAGATATLSPTPGAVASGTSYPVQPSTFTQYLLTLKVNTKTALSRLSDWVAPAIGAAATKDSQLLLATAYDQRTTGKSVVIRSDGKIVVAGGGVLGPADPYWGPDFSSFPVPDERVFDPATGMATTTTRSGNRSGHVAVQLPNSEIEYFGGTPHSGMESDDTIGSYGGEVYLEGSRLRDRYSGAQASLTLDGKVVLLGGKGAWMEWASADHTWYYIQVRQGFSNWIETLDPLTGAQDFWRMRYPRSNGAAVPLKDGRLFVAGGGSSNWEQPEVLDLAAKTSSLTAAFKGWWDAHNAVAKYNVAGAALMQDGKVLILERQNLITQGSGNPQWLGIWDPISDTYARRIQAPGDICATFVGDPIGDGLYPIGFIQRATIDSAFDTSTPRGSYILFYDSAKNVVVVSEDLKTSMGTRWLGMTAQGDVLIEAPNKGTAEPWRVNLALPVTTFPSSLAMPLGQSFKLSSWTAKNEVITWSVLEGATGGSVASDGTYHAPVTAGIYHVVATAPSGRSISTIKVLPSLPSVTGMALDKTSGQAGTVVTVSWNVHWADTLHLQTRDNNDTILQDLDVTGAASAIVTVTSTTASFVLIATNASGSSSASAFFAQWGVYSVGISPNGTQYMVAGTTRTFTASVFGIQGTPNDVTWNSLPAGSITANGIYTAPLLPGNYSITATSTFDPSKSAAITVIVGIPPTLTGFTASPAVVAPGMPTTLTWQASGATSLIITTPPDPLGSGAQYWDVSQSSSLTAHPTRTTTYTLSVSNPFGGATRSVQVTVSPVSMIAINPSQATAYIGSPLSFGASITTSGSTAVTWSTDDPGATLSSSGLSATYMPGTSTGTYHVTVTSVADPTRSASCQVAVTYPSVQLTVSPPSATMETTQTCTFGYSITASEGVSKAVTWSIVEGPAGGAISIAGLYVPPPVAGAYHVKATSQANPAVSSTATVTVIVPQVTLSITPATVTLSQGSSFRFGCSSSQGSVIWSTSGGLIDSTGTYVAPVTVGNYTVSVTSSLNPTSSASATVTVVLASTPSIALLPGAAGVFPGGNQPFTAKVLGLSDPTLIWSLQNPSSGSITNTGQYTAPMTAGIDTIVATSVQDPTISGRATISVGNLILAPQLAMTAPGMSVGFSASILQGLSGPVAWSVDETSGGIMDPDGTYTAPPINGIYHIRGTLPDGSTQVATAQVGLIDALVIGFPVQVAQAGAYRISASLTGSNGKSIGQSRDFYFDSGTATPELAFDAHDILKGLGVDGPWTVTNVQVEAIDGSTGGLVPSDSSTSLGNTNSYLLRQLQQPWATLPGSFTSNGIAGSTGPLLGLQANIGVNLLAPGTYSISAMLVDGTRAIVASSGIQKLALPAGTSTVTLTFPGNSIALSQRDGPYQVVDMVIIGFDSQGFPAVGSIDGYTWSQFQ